MVGVSQNKDISSSTRNVSGPESTPLALPTGPMKLIKDLKLVNLCMIESCLLIYMIGCGSTSALGEERGRSTARRFMQIRHTKIYLEIIHMPLRSRGKKLMIGLWLFQRPRGAKDS